MPEFSYVDHITGEPCPRRGNVLCTLAGDDPAHRHVAAHMWGRSARVGTDCPARQENHPDHTCRCARRPGHPENSHLCADCRAQWRGARATRAPSETASSRRTTRRACRAPTPSTFCRNRSSVRSTPNPTPEVSMDEYQHGYTERDAFTVEQPGGCPHELVRQIDEHNVECLECGLVSA